MSFINVHTHIFNAPCVPNAFLSNYKIPRFIASIIRAAVHKKALRKVILWLLSKIPGKVNGLQLSRYAALIDVASNKSQSDVFDILSKNYPSEAQFVVLTMNFDFMTGSVPDDNYNTYLTQLHEVLEVKEIHENKVIPFLFIDPRMGASQCMELLEKYLNPDQPKGIAGIKIYPSLGYYPFHPNMEPVYAYAERYGIPVLTHANKDGGAYYAGRFLPAMFTYLSFNETPESTQYLNDVLPDFPSFRDPRNYANILMHPVLYTDVLRKFPKLKLCLAHFGGDDEVLAQDGPKADKYNWTKCIKTLIKEFPNVYTDISFTLSNKKASKRVLADLADPAYKDRILFGTDFFMTAPLDSDEILTRNFFEIAGNYRQLLTETNPVQFLSSPFFQS
ncbi:MAG: amidohydrolase family protein [Ferruginibacter sp.]|nr:amidohydrolase family protein [Chitinophagaceae bacterium]